jgi:protein-tyrosine phosphatase
MLLAPPPGTFWVALPRGRVLAGPHPVVSPEGMEDRLQLLIDEIGIDHFVDLSTRHDWMPEYEATLPPHCRYTRYEIIDRRLPEDPPALKRILLEVKEEAADGRLAYVHCQAGVGRTGTVIGALLREAGFAGQAALDELVRLRALAGLHEGSPEFEAQREFVRHWVV